MSARVLSFSDFAPKPGEFSLLTAELPGASAQPIGVVLLDPKTDTLYVRLRRDWGAIASDEDAEVLAELEDDLLLQARERGGTAVLQHLENVASNSIRITDREAVTVRDFERRLGELYREQGRTDNAVSAYERYLRATEGSRDAQVNRLRDLANQSLQKLRQ